MIPDLKFLAGSFRRFNTAIFSGSLPEPRFLLSRARTFRGKLSYRCQLTIRGYRACDFEMRLSTDFDLPHEEWEDVVIHEMIHLHIAFFRVKDTSPHGPAFRKMMAQINSLHGRHITVSARSPESAANASGKVRGHFICIVKFSDGRLALAPVAKTRIFQLRNLFPRFEGVVAVRWVGSTDPWFNRFPHVMTPKLYAATRETLLEHLKGGVLLEVTERGVRVVSRRCFPDELLP